MPAGADGDDVPGPALVGRDHVGAAAEQQQRTAGLVGLAHGGDQFGGVLDLDQPVDRAADAERGEVRQPDVASNLHGPTLAGTTLRTGERGRERPQAPGIPVAVAAAQGRPGWPPAGPARWGCRPAGRRTPTGCAGSTAGCSPRRSPGCATPRARWSSTSGYGASAVTTLELVERLGPEVERPRGRRAGDRPGAGGRGRRRPRSAAGRLPGRRLRAGRPAAGARAGVQRAAAVRRGVGGAGVGHHARRPGPGRACIVEGTCDEWGRRSAWVALDADGPLTLTLATRVSDIATPSDLAERLPKALIHHNVPGQPVHEFLRAFDAAWAAAAGLSTFGPRQRWVGGRRGAGRRRAGRWSARPAGGGTARSPCAGRRSRRSEADPAATPDDGRNA